MLLTTLILLLLLLHYLVCWNFVFRTISDMLVKLIKDCLRYIRLT